MTHTPPAHFIAEAAARYAAARALGVTIDRYGSQRCGGYRPRDFLLCTICPLGEPSPLCGCCGGYGEVPEPRPQTYVPDDVQ